MKEIHHWVYTIWATREVSIYSPAAAAKSLQSCDPIDGSPPGSPVPGILQARTLKWVAISFSNAWKWKWNRSVTSDSSRPHELQPTSLLRPWDLPGESTGVGCHRLLQYIALDSPKVVLVAQACPTLCNPMYCGPPASLFMGLSRQEYWSGLPFLSPEDLSDPGIKPGSPAMQADSLPPELHGRSILS